MHTTEEIIEQRAKTIAAVPIEVTLIDPSPFQGRRRFDLEGLASLAESIKKQLLNAIYVRQVGVRYELIAGERRWRAVKDVLKWTHIDAKVIACSNAEAAELCAEENFQREDFLPSEKGRQVKNLKEQGVSTERIIKVAGSKAKMETWLQIADLPEAVQTMLDARQIKMTTVSLLANIDGEPHQLHAAELAKTGQLTKVELQARTQHLPQRSSPRSPAIAKPLFQVVSADGLNRLLINVQQKLGRFSLSSLHSPRQKEVLAANVEGLLTALRHLQQQLR